MKPSLHRQKLGKTGEDLASEYLRHHGYTVIERNFKARYGELDIIAVKDNTLVVIEVKTRENNAFGNPEEAITKRKLRELILTTQYYSVLHPELPQLLRIDLIAIAMNTEVQKYRLKHITDISS